MNVNTSPNNIFKFRIMVTSIFKKNIFLLLYIILILIKIKLGCLKGFSLRYIVVLAMILKVNFYSKVPFYVLGLKKEDSPSIHPAYNLLTLYIGLKASQGKRAKPQPEVPAKCDNQYVKVHF
ncbi:hypothetical protein CON89_26185 [Bacillus toyonensis]|nr:hypothetical protein CON89_26185 [Bacillus toyonensis]